MVYTYSELLRLGYSREKINSLLKCGNLKKIEKGIYTNGEHISEIAIVFKKYKNIVITMESAFYYHVLTDIVPSKIHVASEYHCKKISRKSIKQIYVSQESLTIGVESYLENGVMLFVYNLERTLIELIKNRGKVSMDVYKEVIGNYRKITHKLDIPVLTDYIDSLGARYSYIKEAIQLEVL
jgi:predicted transcriptional regulator of viral defense system